MNVNTFMQILIKLTAQLNRKNTIPSIIFAAIWPEVGSGFVSTTYSFTTTSWGSDSFGGAGSMGSS